MAVGGTVGRMSDDERDGPDRSRLLFVLALVLALGATVAVVFTDSALWLRFAVLAALWSAVVGGSIALVYRHRCRERDAEMAELRSRYEQEIEREVTARREYELQVESEIRAEVEQANTEVLYNLRDEVRSLRANVDAMLGGEVMVERIAWHAESTRLRAHQEHEQRQPPVQQRRVARQPPGGQPATVRSTPVEPASPPAPEPPVPPRQQAPSHTQNGFHAPAGPAGGRHTQPEMRPAAPEPGPPEPDDAAAGAHTAGTSVTELLAAHGGATGGRRHRRRAE